MSNVVTVIKLIISRGGQQVVGMLGLVYFTRVLSPENLGIYFIFQAVVTVLALFSDLGIKGAIEKFVSEDEAPGSVLMTGVLLRVSAFLPLCLILVLFRDSVDAYIGAHVWPLVIISIAVVELAKLSIIVLRAEQRVDETATLEFLRQLAIVGIGALLLQFSGSVISLLYAYIIGNVVTGVFGVYKIETSPSAFSRDVFLDILSYAKHNFVSTIAGVFHNRADVLLIAFFMTSASVAIYEVAWRVSSVVVLFTTPIATTLFPEMSSLSTDNAGQVKEIVQDAIPYTLIFAVPALFGGFVLGQDLLGLVFGTQYGSAWLILSVLLLQKVFLAPFTIIARSLQAINRPDLVAKGEFIGMVANFVGNVVLISQFGLIGAAVATAGAFALDLLMQTYYFTRIYELSVDTRFLSRIFTSAVGMLIGVSAMKRMIHIDSLFILLPVIGISVCLYLVLLLTYTPLRRDTISLIHRVQL
jgi:O-antigen/teichoic acid export membrane protein